MFEKLIKLLGLKSGSLTPKQLQQLKAAKNALSNVEVKNAEKINLLRNKQKDLVQRYLNETITYRKKSIAVQIAQLKRREQIYDIVGSHLMSYIMFLDSYIDLKDMQKAMSTVKEAIPDIGKDKVAQEVSHIISELALGNAQLEDVYLEIEATADTSGSGSLEKDIMKNLDLLQDAVASGKLKQGEVDKEVDRIVNISQPSKESAI